MDRVSSDVFDRMDCLEKKWPLLFSDQEKLNVASDFCSRDLEGDKDVPFFEYVQDLIGSNNVKSLVEYKQIKGIWNIIRTIGSPTLYDSEGDIHYEGQLYLKKEEEDFIVWDLNMPLSPVMSSVVQARAVKDDKLYVRFHSSPENTYKYQFEGNDEAVSAFNEMTEGSPGRWVWKNLRGHSKGEATGIENVPEKYGRVSGSGKLVKKKGQSITRTGERQTIGGIGSEGYQSKPYEKIGKVIQGIEEVPQMEELATQMREYKMSVKAEDEGATSGEPFKVSEIESYQKKIYEEKSKRKKIKDDVKTMLSKIKTQKFKQTKTKKPSSNSKKDKTITKPNDALSRHTKKLGKDFDESKGRWITVKGKHIFLEHGKKLSFGKDGKYTIGKGESKPEEIKRKIKEKGLEKEPIDPKKQKEQEDKEKEEDKEIEQEAKRRTEIDKRGKAFKKEKEPEEREAGVQKIIEKTGVKREEAEKRYDEKHPDPKKIEKEEKEAKKSEDKEVKIKGQIDKKKEALKGKYEQLMKVNKGKPGSEILKNVIELAVKAMIAAEKGDITTILSDINKYRKKVKNDHKLTEAQRQKLADQINSIRSDIDKLQSKQDFDGIDMLIEIAELEVELEVYDYYFNDNSEEYEDYIRGIENE